LFNFESNEKRSKRIGAELVTLLAIEIGGGGESVMTNPVPNLGVFQKQAP